MHSTHDQRHPSRQTIEQALSERILILDGAMGTMIQSYGLAEADYRNAGLQHHPLDVKGNNELLNLTRPDVIGAIHRQYLEAGADVICTNTFNGNRISQADYQTAHLVYQINYEAARLARQAVADVGADRPLFVAGAMGPTTKLASLSPDVNNPAARAVAFDELVEAFTEQAQALVAGGVDVFLLETITDTLNAKAALFALMQLFERTGRPLPIMVSATITDASGRILSGQTLEAFLISVSHAPLLSVGLNCALGAAELRPYVQELARLATCGVSTHPNAGLPNEFGAYEQTPEQIAGLLAGFARQGWINLVGGCCGTTPDHIRAIAESVRPYRPRPVSPRPGRVPAPAARVAAFTGTSSPTDAPAAPAATAKTPHRPSYSLRELMQRISAVEDEAAFYEVKTHFDREKALYHPEQARLLEAHLFGRFQYLRVERRLAKVIP